MASHRSAGGFAAWALSMMSPLVAQAAGCHVETMDLPVTMVGARATTTIAIDGNPVTMIVDSGASFSMLTDAAAEQLKLYARSDIAPRVNGVTGSVPVRMATVDRLQFGKGELKRVDFLVGGNEPGAGAMGVMGRNILSLADTEYDLAHGVVRLMFPNDACAGTNMAYWAGATPVVEAELLTRLHDRTPAIRARVSLNGTGLVALFDSGAVTVVSLRAARKAGATDADLKPSGTLYGAGRGRAEVWTAPFERFELGDETIQRNRLRVSDFDIDDGDLLLGIEFFLAHRIYVSRQQSKVFITYNGGPVFGTQRDGGADPQAREAADAPPATADAFARRGAASASRRDYESALRDLDRACDLAPTSAPFLAQRGALEELLQRPVKALADYDRALELDPTWIDARFGRARLRLAAKDRDGVQADLDALGDALAPQAPMRLDLSRLYLAVGQPARALAQLNLWLPAHASEVRRDVALDLRCRVRLMLGIELAQALDDCDDAVAGDAKNPEYLSDRGWAHLRLAEDCKALADFDRSIGYRPLNAPALYGRGVAKTRLGDAIDGDVDLGAARRMQPGIEARLARAGLSAPTATTP